VSQEKMVFFQILIYGTLKMQLNMVVARTMAIFWVFTMCTIVYPDVSKECAASVFRVT